jgi:membrane-associated phospholipid phosphatase
VLRLFPWSSDRLHLAFFALQAGLTLAAWGRLEHAAWWLAFDVFAVVSLGVMIRLSGSMSPRGQALGRLIHGCVAIPLVFTQVGLLLQALTRRDLAEALAAADRRLFLGRDPLMAMEPLARPWLTELMQVLYTLYIVLPPATAVLLALRAGPSLIRRSLAVLLAVFYLSYVGYYLFPASGPNIHNNFGPVLPCGIDPLPLYHFESDLPGLWLTAPLREWMFRVELTKRDCFPSGHVAAAVVCWILAGRVHRLWGLVWAPFALGVILSTVYLRYHYVVDVLAGMLLGWICAVPLDRWLRLREEGPEAGRTDGGGRPAGVHSPAGASDRS